MVKFVSKKRVLTHIKSGWCVRELSHPKHAFRVFYGVLQPGADHPNVVHAYSPPDADGEFVDMPDFEAAVRWVEERGPKASRRLA